MDVFAIHIKMIKGRQSDQHYRHFAEHNCNVAGHRLGTCQLKPDEINKGWAKIAAKCSVHRTANPRVIPGRGRRPAGPESIITSRSVGRQRSSFIVWGYGFRARHFVASRNDVATTVTTALTIVIGTVTYGDRISLTKGAFREGTFG